MSDRDVRLARLREHRHSQAQVGASTVGQRVARVCTAAACTARGADEIADRVRAAASAQGLGPSAVKTVGCIGLCAAGPLIEIDGQLFERVRADDTAVNVIVGALGGAAGGRPLATDPFFARQVRIVLENSGRIDPESIEDYLRVGGYDALGTVVGAVQTDVLDEVVKSGLRGRGGAGYPTGLKWTMVAKASAAGGKYVVCNGDEGDPGAFMDRSILESDPQRVLEGMAIAAYAVGADRGYLYVRAEYPLALDRLRKAIVQAERHQLLGHNIADSGFDFHVEIRVGAGAYVCGEETALIASIEGGRGTPRPRPPFPSTAGLWGRPTLINNVETFANIPWIIHHGADRFAEIGNERSKGTKVFALAGPVHHGGLVEVPMGMTLREVVFGIGGGMEEGHRFKAVQTGGPSGGCLPEALLDMPVDYESLTTAGSIMGSGGMIVMDERSCMVDVAKYFLDFCRQESCGKCLPCRVGTVQLHSLLDAISHGTATMRDIDRLERLSEMVQSTSLCGLGQNAPNPVFSTLRYFRDEYEGHVGLGRCPAGVCPMAGGRAS